MNVINVLGILSHTLIESRLCVWDFSAATSVYCDVESSKLRLAMGVGKLRYGGEVNEILGHGDWGLGSHESGEDEV